MSVETFALDIPQHLYERIKRFAQITHRPVEKLMLQTLGNIPALPENLPESVTQQLIAIEELDDDSLWEIAEQNYEEGEQKRYSSLLKKQAAGNLDIPEKREIEQHLEAVSILTLKKAYAYALLKWRGHVMPTMPHNQMLH